MQIVVNGVLTNYQIVGKGKKNLVILHGWQRSLNEWLPLAKRYSETYTSVLLDLPGFGSTALPHSAYSIYDYAAFVQAFLNKLEITHYSLLGHSFGGRIGVIMATQTDDLETLILVDAAGVEKRSPAAKVKISLFKSAKVFLPKPFVKKLRGMLGSRDYNAAGPLREIFLKVINEDLTPLFSKIKQKTFLIWGEKDPEVPMWKAKLMRRLIPDSKLRIVWRAEHSPHLEKPKEFFEILDEVL
jgi:pimeloyl-ACP methyl ester carboxylesterase